MKFIPLYDGLKALVVLALVLILAVLLMQGAQVELTPAATNTPCPFCIKQTATLEAKQATATRTPAMTVEITK